MTTQVSDPLAGRLLDGRYRVGPRIARGGMASVYLGTDIRLERQVAIKVMAPQFAHDPAFVDRFIREARSAARLVHPDVVAVWDQGEDDGTVFLVMEYVPGRTLRDVLAERGRLDPRTALDLLDPVLLALAAAHAAGIVHRDVKPENVLLGDDGSIKVADFGLAKAFAERDQAPTRTQGLLLGTAAYLPPELVTGEEPDARSDVYSAGVMLFEMLTGRPPFQGENSVAVAYQHVRQEVPPPSTLVPGLHPALDSLVVRATRRERPQRPADAGVLLAAVRSLRERVPEALLPAVRGRWSEQETVVVATLPGAVTTTAVLSSDPALDPAAPPQTPVGKLPRSGPGAVGGPPHLPRGTGAHRAWRVVAGLLVLLLLAVGVGVATWWLAEGRWSAVPSVLEMDEAKARAELGSQGYSVASVDRVFREDVPAGQVVSTDPPPGERVLDGADIALVVSRGPQRFEVPVLVGRTVAEARDLLADQQLVLDGVAKVYDETKPKGEILTQGVPPGQDVRKGTPVAVSVSKGPQPFKVPRVVGKPVDTATEFVTGRNLEVVTAEAYSDTVPEGVVISQKPAKGTLFRGDTVSLVVSLGPELFEVPGVLLQTEAEARRILEAAGFVVETQHFPGTPTDRVIRQSPGGGTWQAKGTVIGILIA